MTGSGWLPSDAELLRYLAGDSTPSDTAAIERWVQMAPEHQQRMSELRAVLEATEPPGIAWDATRSWERLAERLEPPTRPVVVRDPPRFRANRLRQALIAAGLAAVFAGGVYLVRLPGSPHAAGRDVATTVVERRTGRGERAAFRLPDGTGVMLGPVSRLRYSSAQYGRSSRGVELEGDGYFQVVHDATHPFVVRTATALIRDLGTQFVIRVRPGDSAVEVGVAEGRVAVGAAATPHDSVMLAAGDVARLDRAGSSVVRHAVNLDRYFAWTEGRLVFERAPLPVVAEELRRWYDVDIELGRNLEHRMLTAAFRDKPVREVLDLIAASLDLTVSGGGKRFVLSAR